MYTSSSIQQLILVRFYNVLWELEANDIITSNHLNIFI